MIQRRHRHIDVRAALGHQRHMGPTTTTEIAAAPSRRHIPLRRARQPLEILAGRVTQVTSVPPLTRRHIEQ
jgi:hypothetical protein